MQKAYDFKKLGKRLLVDLKEQTKDFLKKGSRTTFKWLKESAEISDMKVDDLTTILHPDAQEAIDKLIDKI